PGVLHLSCGKCLFLPVRREPSPSGLLARRQPVSPDPLLPPRWPSMCRGSIDSIIGCLVLLSALAPATAEGIQLTNLKDEATIRSPVPLLQGTRDDKAATAITVVNQSSGRPTKELKGIARKGRFKALAELLPGPNRLLLRAGNKELKVTLNYKPQ